MCEFIHVFYMNMNIAVWANKTTTRAIPEVVELSPVSVPDEPTEVVGLTGLPPAEDGGVQMGSSVMEDRLNDICNGANTLCELLVSVSALTCAKYFNLCQEEILILCHVDPEVPPTCKCCEVHHNWCTPLFTNN